MDPSSQDLHMVTKRIVEGIFQTTNYADKFEHSFFIEYPTILSIIDYEIKYYAKAITGREDT